jgi:phosphoglycolate phosphatase
MIAFQNALFDLDGTLVDSLPGIAWSMKEALRANGLAPLSRDLRPLIGPPIRDILAAVSGAADSGLLDRLEAGFRSSYDSVGWRRTVCQKGVPDMLWRLLTAGVELWVVTNKPAVVTGRILRELKIGAFFKEIACRDSRTPPFGSKEEILEDLLERRGLDRAACLLIGDTAEDWKAAEAAGIACAIVPHGYGNAALPLGCRPIGGWHELCRSGIEVNA